MSTDALAFASSFVFACPACREPVAPNVSACTCGVTFSHAPRWLDLRIGDDFANRLTERAYKLYALLYAPVALASYWLVWRGNLRRHVAFFREVLAYGRDVVDVATGDGSLTALALFKGPKAKRARHVVALDISRDMLETAVRKLPANATTIVRGDVMRLPFGTGAVKVMTCFGGFNSFPAGATAMRELERALAKDGRIRGSVLLMPEKPWRQRLVRRWIAQGYQTEEVTEARFRSWVDAADLEISALERHGDVLLFELKHRGVAS